MLIGYGPSFNYVQECLYHLGDTDTRICFYNDRIRMWAGGVDMVDIIEDAVQDRIIFNNAEADVDFRVAAVGQTNALFIQGSDGKIGIGTAVIPHGGIGTAKLALEGTNANVDGPHIQITTSADDYPLMHFLMWAHDGIRIGFDAYNLGAGAWKSSYVGSNFMISKGEHGSIFAISYDSGIALGANIGWNDGITLDIAGNVGIGAFTHGANATITLFFPNTATNPTTSVDLMHIYCVDRAVGNAQFACYQESAMVVDVDETKFSHKWPVRLNNTDYFIMLTTT